MEPLQIRIKEKRRREGLLQLLMDLETDLEGNGEESYI